MVKNAETYSFNWNPMNAIPNPAVWDIPSVVLDLTPFLIQIRAAWRGKLE